MNQQEHSGDHFDLLPFIAILMCVLGCLLLVTVSMSAISMGIGAGEVWLPAAAETGSAFKAPILVEFDGSSAVFHLDGSRTRVPWKPGSRRTISIGGSSFILADDDDEGTTKSTSPIVPILKSMEPKKDTCYALIAVRPSGFSHLHQFLAEFRGRNITVGFEPIEQSRPVSLAEFVPHPSTVGSNGDANQSQTALPTKP